MNDSRQLILWLREKAGRASDLSWGRMMSKAADRLEEQDKLIRSLEAEKRAYINGNFAEMEKFLAYENGKRAMRKAILSELSKNIDAIRGVQKVALEAAYQMIEKLEVT